MNKAQSTTEELAQGMKSLMMRMPFEKITIKKITDESKLMRPTFYNHFKDKYDVVEWIFRHDIVEPADALLENGMNQQALQLMFINLAKERRFYKKALKIEGQNSFYEIMNRVYQDVMLRVLRDKEMDSPILTRETVAGYFANSLTYITKRWILVGEDLSMDAVMEVVDFLANRSINELLK